VLFFLVVGHSYAANTAPYFGPTGFTTHNIITGEFGANHVAAADVDGDGDMDLLSAANEDDRIVWYENDGSQNFTVHDITLQTGESEDGVSWVAAADLDDDGDMDVLSAAWDDNKIVWYENNGSESFTAHNISFDTGTTTNGAICVTTADVDDDGDLDVLYAATLSDKIGWFENNGSESFTNHNIPAGDGPRLVVTADVDDDGDLDLASASRNDGTIAWYENDGSENFTRRIITADADDTRGAAVADVDGDGDIDVLSASVDGNTIAWYENDGAVDPTFTKQTITTTEGGVQSVTTADVDGDGDIDVISAAQGNNTVAWWENDGSANPTFTKRTITSAAGGPLYATTADVDGDGDLDVLSASWIDDTVDWYENDGGLNGAPTFVKGGPPVILDADANVSDAELDAFNTGNGDYDGASLTLVRNGGVSSQDVFSFIDGNGITLSGSSLSNGSGVIATFDITTTSGDLLQR